eukprot:5293657-Pyramimonas_sp.AAC.1
MGGLEVGTNNQYRLLPQTRDDDHVLGDGCNIRVSWMAGRLPPAPASRIIFLWWRQHRSWR